MFLAKFHRFALQSKGKTMMSLVDLNGDEQWMLLPCTPEQLRKSFDDYDKGALIQNAFPYLNAGEREFILTGMTPEMWAEWIADEMLEARAITAQEGKQQ